MTKTLADMEKRMARMETNQANAENMETKFTNLEKRDKIRDFGKGYRNSHGDTNG